MRYSPICCQLLCFLLFLSYQASLSSSSSSSHDQSAALIQFKTLFSINKTASEDCGISSYPKTNSWKEGTNCCLWDGVSCDNITGQVISLDLSCSQLFGMLPSNSSLSLLSQLQRLDLSFNDFKKSRIPSVFGRFASLTHLDLSNSWFSGLVPHEISYLSKLVVLDLSSRSVIDPIGFQALEPILKLEKSTLNGIVGNLTEVREISLKGIDMSSIDLNSFMNLSSSLTSLHLASCDLHGNFPENFFNLPNIKALTLDFNPSLTGQLPKSNWSGPLELLTIGLTSFSGELPASIGNLKSLQGLSLSNCNFSASIPSSLGSLSQLSFMYLSFNNFNGRIPDNPNSFPNLRILDLSNNLLSGTTPSWLSTHPSLYYLNLGNNQFIGHINEFQHSALNCIILKNNTFQGKIPSSIWKLVNLTFLDLSSNSLNGTISSNNSVNFVLPNLKYVNLTSCNISEVPNFLEGSKVLKTLDLSNNRILGQISKIPWQDIEFLDLHSNLIQGDLPILPHNIRFFSISNNNLTGDISGICNMKFVQILDLSHNNFSGTIPPCIGSFSKSLSLLNLKMNKFHGIIPPTFAKGCGLKNLNFNGNHLEGPLTRSISNCKDLEVLDLGNNKISGTFPHWIEELSELQVLVLHSNKFQGSIDASKNPRSLPKLRIIDLSYNNLFGPLPTSYLKNFKGMMTLDEGKDVHYMQARNYSYDSSVTLVVKGLQIDMRYMQERNFSYDYSVALVVKGLEIELAKILTIFTSIDLSKNNFVGEIPGIIGELRSLRGLNLSHNNLIGHIPSSLKTLTSLEWLDLSSNKLGGQIPRELADLTFLSFFNVSYNQLVGPIPQGNQFNNFGSCSYEGNKGLYGLPLSRGCSSDEQPRQPPSGVNLQKDDGSKFEFGWEPVVIGYAFGFIFGGAIGYIGLGMGKFKWIMSFFEGYIPRKARRV